MSQFMSQKISLKNILIGAAIEIGMCFLILLIFYYIFAFLPEQERKKQQKAMEKYEIFLSPMEGQTPL